MPAIYQFLGTHEVLIYIVLSIGAMFALRWLWRSWREWRHAVYGLEREFALRRIAQSIAVLFFLFLLFAVELATAAFIYPNLPASYFMQTATPDFLATPTGTISPELATAIAMTPRPSPVPEIGAGCLAKQVEISSPEPGAEVRGTVEIRGTVSIPDFGFYKYEVSPAGAESWATIAAGRVTVVDASLGQWDTSNLAPGDYDLRLVVSDNQGRGLPACLIRVRVAPQP